MELCWGNRTYSRSHALRGNAALALRVHNKQMVNLTTSRTQKRLLGIPTCNVRTSPKTYSGKQI